MRGRLGRVAAPLSHRDFRLLWLAQLCSELGDFAARIAVALLVLERTGSPTYTTLVIALGFLPWLGVGQFVATWADRFPRRTVMVVADLVRAVIVAAMLLPVPIGVLLALVFLAGLASPPFEAARTGLMPNLLPERLFGEGVRLATITYQFALLVGYLSGGGLAAAIGTRAAIAANAVSFLVSAVLLLAISAGRTRVAAEPVRVRDGVQATFGDPMIRRSISLLAGLSLFGLAVEALVPVAVVQDLGGSEGAVGVVAALIPGATILVAAALPSRHGAERLLRLAAIVAGALALGAGLLFIASFDLPLAALPFAAIGGTFAASIPISTAFALHLSDDVRTSAASIMLGVNLGASGVGALLGGVAAHALGTTAACALASFGLCGVCVWSLVSPVGQVRPAKLLSEAR
jgi:MFS family permease